MHERKPCSNFKSSLLSVYYNTMLDHIIIMQFSEGTCTPFGMETIIGLHCSFLTIKCIILIVLPQPFAHHNSHS